METKHLTCIGCPLGCALCVEMSDGEILKVSGNTCKRGDIYARKEVTNPTRIVTGTVRVSNGDIPMVSVKTESDIPKDKIMDIMNDLRNLHVTAPVHIGDVLLADAANTGVNIIATKDIARIRTDKL